MFKDLGNGQDFLTPWPFKLHPPNACAYDTLTDRNDLDYEAHTVERG